MDLDVINKNAEYVNRHPSISGSRLEFTLYEFFDMEMFENIPSTAINAIINTSTIELVWDGRPNKGFYQAHHVFRTDKIISILYEKINNNEIRDLVELSSTPL